MQCIFKILAMELLRYITIILYTKKIICHIYWDLVHDQIILNTMNYLHELFWILYALFLEMSPVINTLMLTELILRP